MQTNGVFRIYGCRLTEYLEIKSNKLANSFMSRVGKILGIPLRQFYLKPTNGCRKINLCKLF